MERESKSSDSPKLHKRTVSAKTDSELLEDINQQKTRNKNMHKWFLGLIPEYETCIADFSCCTVKYGISLAGRLYVTQNFCLFFSHINQTKDICHVSEITGLSKGSTLGLPMDIDLETDKGVWKLRNFLFRDNAYKTIESIINGYKQRIDDKPQDVGLKIEKKDSRMNHVVVVLLLAFLLFNLQMVFKTIVVMNRSALLTKLPPL
ncbi:hypothetical protein HDV01_005733 [Terramyces sp. JEL0728]|nr:hypothetical protein HDV01_005733 [Terramyces sp. JEL0728]